MRVDIGGQVHAGKFARQALLAVLRQHGCVVIIGSVGIVFQHLEHAGGLGPFQHRAAALVVDLGLRRELPGRGNIELPIQYRIARRVFVDVGGAVADPLTRHENRQLDVQLDLAHLERRRMPVAHQVTDQPLVVGHMPGAGTVRDAGGLDDGGIVAHVINDADKAVVQNLMRAVKMRLHPFGNRPQRGARRGALCVDFGDLVGGKRHGGFLGWGQDQYVR